MILKCQDTFTSGVAVVKNFMGRNGLLRVGGAPSHQNSFDMAAGLKGKI
jgi:hypothetical protein